MKKKVLLIIILIIVLFIWWLFLARLKMSNSLRNWLLREDKNWIIQQVTRAWNDMSIDVTGPQTALRIPIPSVVPETLTRENFKFKLNLYDENWNKLDYIVNGIERWEWGWVTSWIVIPIFKDSILWMKEYKIPKGFISKIDEDVFQIELEDFNWYVNENWEWLWYKLFWKWKIDSVYLQVLHWPKVRLEFSMVE